MSSEFPLSSDDRVHTRPCCFEAVMVEVWNELVRGGIDGGGGMEHWKDIHMDLAECIAKGVQSAKGNPERAVRVALDALMERFDDDTADYLGWAEEMTRDLAGPS